MSAGIEQNNVLDQLIQKAEADDAALYDLALTYVYLMASSNIGLIGAYQDRVIDTINKWRGSLKIGDALYYLVKGYSFFFLTKPSEGLNEFDNMFAHCSDTELFRSIKGAGYIGMGVCHRSLGSFDKTMEDCMKGMQHINTEGKPEVWEVYLFRMLGEIHVYIGEMDEAINYYLKAKTIMETVDDSTISTAYFRVYDALGNCYYEMGDFIKAEEYLNAAMSVDGLSVAEKARVLCDFGILYLSKPKDALTYFEQSCSLRQTANLEDAYTTSLIYKAECLMNLGDLSEAKQVLDEAILLVDKYNVPTKRLHLYRLRRAWHELNGMHKEAINYFHLYDDLKSKIQLEQNQNIFHIKNKLIADQHAEIEQKHVELKETLSELARIKVSRKAMFFSIITVVVLVILTEVFLEPMIEQYSMNEYISIASKILIAFLLKPIDTLYERLLFRRAYKV